MPKIVFLHHCYLALRSGSRSKVGVKVTGQGHRSRSKDKVQLFILLVGARLCQVQQRAIGVITSLEVFVCVSVISGRVWVISQMRPIGF